MRVVYDVFIELDVEKALKNGMDLFLSKNNMILTQGLNGIISPVKNIRDIFILNFFRNTLRKF